MKFFDTHVHFFPDKLAGKALPKLREISQCETHSDGTRSGTVKNFAEWGCAGGMVLHIATNAHQQTSVNNFAKESQHGNLYCFGSVYPYAENALEEMERIKEMGLYGIKLHPDYQEFFIGDEGALPIYAQAEKLGLPRDTPYNRSNFFEDYTDRCDFRLAGPTANLPAAGQPIPSSFTATSTGICPTIWKSGSAPKAPTATPR